METNGNGIKVTKSQVAFWTQVVISVVTVSAVYFGAARPAQPQTSVDNQQQILANQQFVMSNVGKVDEMLANQKKIISLLEGLEKKK